ncbi:protein of unknown function [Clostridium beijerinckii]|nr:protein of unknown function [Clostridium beijerinckii]
MKKPLIGPKKTMFAPVINTDGNIPTSEMPILIIKLIGIAIELLFLKISITSFILNMDFSFINILT